MLKREITYEDFDGNQVTDTLYFNLTKSELVSLEAEYDGGLYASIKRIMEANDQKSLIEEFKKIILISYGQKSEDGKRFIKSDDMRTEFSQSAAYDALFMELATSDTLAAEFMTGIIPRDMAKAIDQAPKES